MENKPFPRTLQEAVVYFADPDTCLEFMVEIRWPNGVTCDQCGSKDAKFIPTRRLWECKNKHAKRQFSVKRGTIFEDSPLGLDKWLVAMWLLANCKNGISSYELHRAIKVTQKSAWFMLHRLRLAMQNGTVEKIDGEVEIDETYIGGKARFMHKGKKAKKIKGRGTAGKAFVMGLLARHGVGKKKHSTVIAHVIGHPTRETLQGRIHDDVEIGAEIHTDEHSGYEGIDPYYEHKVINHAETYAKGTVTTNRIENFWSLVKRGIKGTYVSVEPFHLFRYVDEQAFRFNERKHENGDAGRFIEAMRGIFGRRVTYKQLIGETRGPKAALTPAT